jgi:hypothetical protein
VPPSSIILNKLFFVSAADCRLPRFAFVIERGFACDPSSIALHLDGSSLCRHPRVPCIGSCQVDRTKLSPHQRRRLSGDPSGRRRVMVRETSVDRAKLFLGRRATSDRVRQSGECSAGESIAERRERF